MNPKEPSFPPLAYLLTGLAMALLSGCGDSVRLVAADRMSLSSSQIGGNSLSHQPAMSADGGLVAFASFASNLVPGDSNGVSDLFLRRRSDASTRRISLADDGSQGNGHSEGPRLSADGAVVLFASEADNLTPGDTNQQQDLFIRDLTTATTVRISGDNVNGNGDGAILGYDLSADGATAIFSARRGGLDPVNGGTAARLFIHQRATGLTLALPILAGIDLIHPALSADGQTVAFVSAETLQQKLWRYQRASATLTLVSNDIVGAEAQVTHQAVSISADGNRIASQRGIQIPGLFNGLEQVLLWDLADGTTTLVSTGPGGLIPDRDSYSPTLSADGNTVAFLSAAGGLVPGDAADTVDLFLFDRTARTTTRLGRGGVARAPLLAQPRIALSQDGGLAAMASDADDLAAEDHNRARDVVLFRR